MKKAKLYGTLAVCLVLLAAVAAGMVLYAGKAREAEKLRDEMRDMELETEGLRQQAEELERALEELRAPLGSPARHGWLSVEAGTLVDQSGQPIQLRGASSHGIMWYPQYGNARALQSLRQAGANLFRIAMYTTENKGYDENPEEAGRMLRMTLENALAANMYAIVDWHVLKDQDPNLLLEDAIAFFDEISALYANEPGVLYEICNEPNGDTTWAEITQYAQAVIPVIRGNAPNAVILVGTPNYSTGIAKAADEPLAYDNILYTYHFYADQSRGGYEKAIGGALEKGVGVFVSEWGVGSDFGDAERSKLLDDCEAFLDYLDENNVSWASWALSNKDEGHSLLRPDALLWSGWSEDDLTDYGRLVFNRLRAGGGA